MKNVATISLLASVFALLAPQSVNADLAAVGPISPVNGFPLWYRDAGGMPLRIGIDPALTFVDPVITGNAFSETIGFGMESFYFMADATIDFAGAPAAVTYRAALESTFQGLAPAPNQQLIFARFRMRIDAPVAGTYTVTHPYGVKVYNVTVPGVRAVNETIDDTLFFALPPPNAPANSLTTLTLGPAFLRNFLRAVNPPPSPGFLGNVNGLQTVTGSPTGNNFVRVQGPVGSNIGGPGIDAVETNQFNLSAQISDIPPVAQDQTATAAQTIPKTIQLVATDADIPPQPLTYSIVTQPINGTLTGLNPATGTVTYTSNPGTLGADSFTFQATDGLIESNVATVSVSIIPNTAPVAQSQAVTVGQDTPTPIQLAATDGDVPAQPLTYSLVAQPVSGTLTGLNPATGAVTYTPNPGFVGLDRFTFQATDGFVNSNVATVSITVPGTLPPVAHARAAIAEQAAPRQLQLVATDPNTPAKSLTYVIVTPPSSGTLTGLNPATGAVTYTSNAAFAGTDSFTFKANNGVLDSNVATVTITVMLPLVAQAQTVSLLFNTSIGIQLVATDPNTPPGPLTFAIVTQPAHGALSAVNAATGQLTYTPNTGFTGTDSFTFGATNGILTSKTATVGITVRANTPPVVPAQTVTVAQNTAKVLQLQVTDPDAPPQVLTYAISTPPRRGTLTGLNAAAGRVTYTPKNGYTGPDSFTITASDGLASSNIGTVTVAVAVNSTPVARNQSVAVLPDTPKAVQLVATDANVPAQPLTYSIVTQPLAGTLAGLNPATGAVTYTPNAGFNGADSFRFVANDGLANSNIATVSISVAPPPPAGNVPPVAQDQAVGVAQGTPKPIQLVATDANVPAQPLTYAIVTPPVSGALTGLTAATGAVTYTPNAGFTGADSFTFRANDGLVNGNVATVTLTVAAVGGTLAPVAQGQAVTVAQDKALAIQLVATDPNVPPQTLRYSIVKGSNGSLGNFNSATGAVTYTPRPGFTGADSFTFKAKNNNLDSNVATVSISVVTNVPPVALNTVASVAPNTTTTVTLTATTPVAAAPQRVAAVQAAVAGGGTLSYAIVDQPAKGTLGALDPATGTLTYTPDPDYSGDDSFTFLANDGLDDSNIAVVSIVVVANQPPVANPQSLFIGQQPVIISLTATDPDAPLQPLTFDIATQPANGTVVVTNAEAGLVTYTPTAGFSGADSFTFTASDVLATSDPATVSITVSPNAANQPPVAFGMNVNVVQDIPTDIVLHVDDPDHGPQKTDISIVTPPVHGTLTKQPHDTYTYAPAAGFTGSDGFTFKGNDGVADSNIATVSITVSSGTANQAPIAQGQAVSAAIDTPLPITLAATDADGPAPMTFAITTQPTNGTLGALDPAAGTVTYTPNAGFTGADSFTFTAADAATTPAVSAPATVSITVGAAVNQAPVATAQAVSTTRDTPLAITLAAVDADGPAPTTFAIAALPTKGTLGALDPAAGTVTYTPNAGFTGADSFTFTAADAAVPPAVSAPAIISITVVLPGDGGVPPPHDADKDGIRDSRDNCKNVANTDQADEDGDGLGDKCDKCPAAEDPTQDDGDEDGVGDMCDNAPEDPNEDQADEDEDGVGDVADDCPSDGGKQGPGRCGCGVPDDDTDGDNIEDCIDEAPGVDDNLDTDEDGIRDLSDNCPNDPNADQADDNADGQGNACEQAGQPIPLIPQLCGAGAAQMMLAGALGLLFMRAEWRPRASRGRKGEPTVS